MRIKVAEGVVAAFEQPDVGAGITRLHLAPVQHFIAFGDHGKVVAGVPQALALQRAQLVDKFRLEEKTFLRVMPAGLFADVVRQIPLRLDGRVQQHRLAAGLLGDMSGIKPAK